MRAHARLLPGLSLLLALTGVQETGTAWASSCSQAARSAELHDGLPAGLLTAIGNVESGGWGWSVNGNDGSPGRRFASAEDAQRYTDGLLAAGARAVDVGCFQVDLYYHPEAFRRWQDGFDEDANAHAAAAILNRLHSQTGDWSSAIARYHSADWQRGQSYLQMVMSAWGEHLSAFAQAGAKETHVLALQSLSIAVAVWEPGAMLRPPDQWATRQARLPRVITP